MFIRYYFICKQQHRKTTMQTFDLSIFNSLQSLEAYIQTLIKLRDSLDGETQGVEKGLLSQQIILLSEISMLDFDGNDPIYFN